MGSPQNSPEENQCMVSGRGQRVSWITAHATLRQLQQQVSYDLFSIPAHSLISAIGYFVKQVEVVHQFEPRMRFRNLPLLSATGLVQPADSRSNAFVSYIPHTLRNCHRCSVSAYEYLYICI